MCKKAFDNLVHYTGVCGQATRTFAGFSESKLDIVCLAWTLGTLISSCGCRTFYSACDGIEG